MAFLYIFVCVELRLANKRVKKLRKRKNKMIFIQSFFNFMTLLQLLIMHSKYIGVHVLSCNIHVANLINSISLGLPGILQNADKMGVGLVNRP